jgi:hypothetical protein
MTEADWLAATDPAPMLDFVHGKASDRKPRLFAVACCRTSRPAMTDERSEQAVNIAERDAEGLVTLTQLGRAADLAYQAADDANLDADAQAYDAAWQAAHAADEDAWIFSRAGEVARWRAEAIRNAAAAVEAAVLADAWSAAEGATREAALAGVQHTWARLVSDELAAARASHEHWVVIAGLVREFLGNPFRPPSTLSHWPSDIIRLSEALAGGATAHSPSMMRSSMPVRSNWLTISGKRCIRADAGRSISLWARVERSCRYPVQCALCSRQPQATLQALKSGTSSLSAEDWPMPHYHGKPVQEMSKREIISAMVAFTVIGLAIFGVSAASGGWWAALVGLPVWFVVANALWIGVQELLRSSRQVDREAP